MNVILGDLPRDDVKLMLCCNLPDQVTNSKCDLPCQHPFPVFRNPHHMNLEVALGVGSIPICPHEPMLACTFSSPKGEGFRPSPEWDINKEHHGVRLFLRLGQISQDDAEKRLHTEIERLDLDRDRRAHSHPLFRHCAARYLAQLRQLRSAEVIEWHVRLLIAHLGDLEPYKVHDGTLEEFVRARLAAGASPTTINRALEVVRTILHRAARVYRDDNGTPWLDAVAPLITMLAESPRSPCPITWDEQDRLLRKLPAHLATMALFAVNTGLRDSNLCGLQWMWEIPIPEIGRSVFVVPPEAFKSKRAHVVILNDAAGSIVQSQRGKHPIWVFPYRGKRELG